MFHYDLQAHSLGMPDTSLCTKRKSLFSIHSTCPETQWKYADALVLCQSGHALMFVACIRRIYRSTDPETRQTPIGAIRLFELLLGAELVGVAALLLALWEC
jgi:hypothetical protein